MSSEFQDWMIKNGIRHKVSTTYHPEPDGQKERKNRELTEMFAAHELEGTDWLTAAPKVQTQVNSRISKSGGQSPCFTVYGFQHKVSSTELLDPIPVYSDPAQRHYSAAEKLNCGKHSQIKYANKFKLFKVSPTWTGPFQVREYNTHNHNVNLDFSDFPGLSNISNKFHTSLLKPFTPNDDIHFPAKKLNRPRPVEEHRWEVE